MSCHTIKLDISGPVATLTLDRPNKMNALNKEILMRLQEEGIASPSYTLLGGRYAIRTSWRYPRVPLRVE